MIRDEMRTSQDGCSLSPLHRQTTCQFPHPSIHRQDGSRTPSPRLPRILHSPHAIDPGQRAEPSDRAMGQTRQKRAGERKGTALARVAPGVGCITDRPTGFSLTSDCQRAARMEPGQLKRASRWRTQTCRNGIQRSCRWSPSAARLPRGSMASGPGLGSCFCLVLPASLVV